MLDTKSRIVLKFLCKECPNGAYKIVETSDIISSMPAKYRVDSEALENILTYLERHDCISIKYDDGSVYCLCVLPGGNEIFEDANSKRSRSSPSPLWFVAIFLVAFIGAICGCLIAQLI